MPSVAAPIAWYGGKARLAPRIVELPPHHATYVEAFGGAAAVLFAKTRATLEVYNDIDSGLVTFFRALRDHPEQLARSLRLTPYSREEFTHCRDTWENTPGDIERARRWYVRMRQAFGCSASVGWGYERDGSLSGGTRARSFASTVDELERFAQRLRGVQSSTPTGGRSSRFMTRQPPAFTSTRRITPTRGRGSPETTGIATS